MPGSWKGLFYLKEGKKCNILYSKTYTEVIKNCTSGVIYSVSV
jgi:hypothetical protein